MNTGTIANYRNYYPIGDVIVIALSIMIVFLFAETFVKKNKNFRIFQLMIGLVCLAAASSLGYHQLVNIAPGKYVTAILILYNFFHVLLFFTLYLFVYYMIELLSLSGKLRRKFFYVVGVGCVSLSIVQILSTPFRFGFYWDPNRGYVEKFHLFIMAYIFFVGIILFLLFRYRYRMVRQIVRGIFAVFSFCMFLLMIAGMHHQTSFTTFTFIMPIITMMYLLHSNPYDISTGALNEASFDMFIREAFKKGEKLVLIYLHLYSFEANESFTKEMRLEVFHFYSEILKKGTLFRLEGGYLVLAFKQEQNPGHMQRVEKLCREFDNLYSRFKADFKAVIMEDVDDLGRDNLYKPFFRFMDKRIGMNTYHYANSNDLDSFRTRQVILAQLEDIAAKENLEDERVLVYCQPVFNVNKSCYDTAEALMRLKLPELGLVPPNSFIPLAEEYNLIHPLSLIILNKTCGMIRKFLDAGLNLHRISVNFSIQEVHDPDFCRDIIDIVKRHKIPYEKVAIELTESRNESEFELVKKHINELKEYGMKFYLDDFGTGYSNFERIMELPFDIIKFDRSLVIESGKDDNSAYMVDTFANMFRKLKYRVLYEGIETEQDEKRCIGMCGQYLQGFKYSKPIRIEELQGFLS